MNPDLRTRHMWRDQPSRMQCWNIRNASYNQLQLVPRPNCLWAFIWKPIVTKVTLVITKFEISHCKKYLSSSICDVLTIYLISDWYISDFLIKWATCVLGYVEDIPIEYKSLLVKWNKGTIVINVVKHNYKEEFQCIRCGKTFTHSTSATSH